ncbi:hypothetical protein EDC04DRAFT_2614041 [Pisolithus marmoratus]|nr:hypothetical protein EDC04DRAFT_2614041 [Pisolithus marmoratus]
MTLIGGSAISLAYAWQPAHVRIGCLDSPGLLCRLHSTSFKAQKNKAAHDDSAKLACEAAGAICTVVSLTHEDDCLRLDPSCLDKPLKKKCLLNHYHHHPPVGKNHLAPNTPAHIGKHYHSFPKGTFKAHFTPPSAPRFVLKHLVAHPLTWTWTTKDGPNKGHSFQVPTTPIHCDKTVPKAIHWIVAIFHSFKAHLNPIALDAESGKVKPGWLRLYQNNLYVHLRGQMKGSLGPARAKPSTLKPPPTVPPQAPSVATSPPENVLETELSKLRQEIAELKEKFTNYIMSHEACCAHCSKSPSASSEEDGTESATPPPQCPLPVLLTLLPDGSSKPVPNPPSWLVTALSQQDLPTTFRDSIYIPSLFTIITSFPSGTLEAIKLKFDGAAPLFLGTHRDRDLRMSTTAQADMVFNMYNLPHDPYVPTLPRRRK